MDDTNKTTAQLIEELGDVSERKLGERELLESKQLMDAVVENVPLMIFLKEARDLRFVLFNKAGEDLLGHDREDLLGKNDLELFPSEQATFFMAKDREVLASGSMMDISEEPIQTAKQGERLLHTRKVCIKGSDGVSKYLLGISEDITERKQAEEKLRTSQQLLEGILNAMPVRVFWKNRDLVYLGCNRAFAQDAGFAKPAEIVGKDDFHMGWRDLAEQYREADRQVIASETALLLMEEPLTTPSGEILTVLTSKLPMRDSTGEVNGVLGIYLDITETKRQEVERDKLKGQLRVAQKMEAIGSLAGGVAHDFNNLLSVILSYTGFAIDLVPEGDPLREDLQEVKKAADRAVALTRQLLAFSRKQVLQPVLLDLNQVATNVEKMLRRILGEDIEYAQVLAPDLGVTLADPGQIEQVIMNLVVNARDAMPEGGKLTLETANVEVDKEHAARHAALQPGFYVQLVVADTGRGMDEQTRSRIFEPFFTTKDKGKGTGLGLSTVYGIVKQSGGNITVASEVGHGTTFTIYLPRELERTPVPQKLETVRRQVTGNETILVVEDEEGLRKVAKRTLEGAGYKVLTAADGDDAMLTSVEYAGEIHLLLTDVVMPRMSGRALAQVLVRTRPTLQVVYMSGYTDDTIVRHGVLDPGTHFVAKPFTAAELQRKIRDVLDGDTTHLAGGQGRAIVANGEEIASPLDKDTLRTLPLELLTQLRKAVIAARYETIVTLIETLRTTAPTVAAELRRMSDIFDYEGIRDLLGK